MRGKEFSNSEPFINPQVRQALSMAVDRDEIAAALGSIDYEWSSNTHGTGYSPWVLSPKSPDFGENAKFFEYTPDEAKAMLAAAGFDDGNPLEFTHIYTNEYAGD